MVIPSGTGDDGYCNIMAFLDLYLATNQEYALYNYVDTPNMDMNTLFVQVRRQITGHEGVVLRLPYWLGTMLSYIANGWVKTFRQNFAASSSASRDFVTPHLLRRQNQILIDLLRLMNLKTASSARFLVNLSISIRIGKSFTQNRCIAQSNEFLFK